MEEAKLLVYNGTCKSITIHGIKFTEFHRTAIVSTEKSQKFENRDDVVIQTIEKTDIIPEKEKIIEDKNIAPIQTEVGMISFNNIGKKTGRTKK